MWDRTFGFAVFSGRIPEEALAYAYLLYEQGLLTHVPIVTRDGGAHACRDCGQLTEHAHVDGRPGAHKSSESPLCPRHRRETITGRKVHQREPVTRKNPVFLIAPADPSKIGIQRKPTLATTLPMPTHAKPTRGPAKLRGRPRKGPAGRGQAAPARAPTAVVPTPSGPTDAAAARSQPGARGWRKSWSPAVSSSPTQPGAPVVALIDIGTTGKPRLKWYKGEK